GTEAAIAGVASLIEAASVWAVLRFLPSAARALIVPILVVVVVYKASHLEDWSHYDVLMLLTFQVGIGIIGGALFNGQFQLAFVVLGVYLGLFGLLAAMVRSL